MGNGMDKVLEGLYVGSIRDSTDRKQLDENKITHIVSVYGNARPLVADRFYLCIAAQDKPEQELSQHFPESNDFIHGARVCGGRVLVHCLAGISRSVTLVIAYVMSVTKYTWRESFNIVHAAHRPSGPNFGFQRQLLSFQYEQLAEERERLKRTWPPSPYDDDALSCYWLALHETWVQTGDRAAAESPVYPLSYNSFCAEPETSTCQAPTQATAISEHSNNDACECSPTEDTTLDNQPSPPRSVHKSQPCQQSSSVPDVGSLAAINELFTPSRSFTQEHVRKLKCSSRARGEKKQNTSNNSSSESESSADEGSGGHVTSDIPEVFSKNYNESEPSEKTTLDDLFANPLG